MKKLKKTLILFCAILLLAGCSDKTTSENEKTAETTGQTAETEQTEPEDQTAGTEQTKSGETAETTETDQEGKGNEAQKEEDEPRETPETATAETEIAETESVETESIEPASSEPKPADANALTIVIDPGHSGVVAEGTEPLGPGSGEYKAADASGTRGVSSGVAEYELTLAVSNQLKAELENRGYTVLMTRESNDVPVSCVQRANVANDAGAAAFIRIHTDGSENQSAQGAMAICTTPQSPFVPGLYTSSRNLSDCVISNLCEATGCVNRGVWETDSMSGNNWSQVPVTLVEMGFMTNPDEDMLMQTAEYQAKIVQGIADGVDAFLRYE